jgi:hypothetical protein
MGSTGDTVSDVQSEAIGIRCPIGDCQTLECTPVAAGSSVVAGQFYDQSNMLVAALESRASTKTNSVVVAYEIPKLAIGPTFGVKPRASETWVAGQRLGFKAASNLFVAWTSDFSVNGHALEGKAANASTCLIHFVGKTEGDLSIASA